MDSVALPVTVSLIHSNLVASQKTLAFASNIKPNPQIHLLQIDQLTTVNTSTQLVKYKHEEEVLHINYLVISEKWYLVLGFYQNLQIWNEDGSRMLGFVSKDEVQRGDNDTFFVGSCSYEKGKSIIIGCSKGTISVMALQDDRLQNFNIRATYQGPVQDPVATMNCYMNIVLSCHENGAACFWDLEKSNFLSMIEGPQVSATASTTLKKFAIVGFGNGEVRIFNLKEKSLLCAVWAHTRWITGVARHSTRPIFVTCAEDGFVHAWALRNGEIEIIASKEHPHNILTGVALVNDSAFVASYDKTRIFIDNLF